MIIRYCWLAAVCILWVGWWRHLPPISLVVGVLLLVLSGLACMGWYLHQGVAPQWMRSVMISLSRYLLVMGLALSWAICAGHAIVSTQLAPELEGVDLDLRLEIESLPRVSARRVSFDAEVLSARTQAGEMLSPFPDRVRLSWYQKPGSVFVKAGQQCQLRVRLKRPRGFVNFFGHDYQRWLLAGGVGATG